jgi:integrase
MPYQEPSGKWRATKMIGGKRKTKFFATKTEAKKWEATQTEEDWQPKEETLTVSFLDFATAYLKNEEERVSEKNLDEKKLSFKRALKVIDPAQITSKVTPAMALLVMQYIARNVSGYAANKARKNLAAAWEWGKIFHGLPKENPFHEVKKFPADSKPRYVPPEEDFWKVYDACEDSRDKTLLLFLLHTGARIQEAFRLVWTDVDFERQQVRLGTRKTATGGMEYAWIPLTTELTEDLMQHKEKTNTILVFANPVTGGKYAHRGKFMHRLCAKAGVLPFGYHAIRHLTATILAHSGLDLPSIQAILRHHNPVTTSRYIQSLGVQTNALESIFGNKKRGGKVTTFTASK